MIASISLIYAELFCILGLSFLLKKAMGCLAWKRSAPVTELEAYVSTTNRREKSERYSTRGVVRGVVRNFLNCKKAFSASLFHVKTLNFSKSVSGVARVA